MVGSGLQILDSLTLPEWESQVKTMYPFLARFWYVY